MASDPIFILCCSRSGSTLLRFIMDTHPKVFCPQELHLCELAESLERVYRGLGNYNEMTIAQENTAIYQPIKKHINQIMLTRAKQLNKEVWCEKSIFTIGSLDRIKRIFANARYICLYRNCLDQMDSMLEVLKKHPSGREYGCEEFLIQSGDDQINGLADYWLSATRIMLDFSRTNEKQCFSLNYENLTTAPLATLGSLFKFLKLKWHPQLLEHIFDRDHTGENGDHKIHRTNSILKSSVGKTPSFETRKLSSARVTAINSLSKQLSYPPISGSFAQR